MLNFQPDSIHVYTANSSCKYMYMVKVTCIKCTDVEHLVSVQDLLVTVFENGELTKEYTFDEIRGRAELPLVNQQTSH